MATWTYVEAYWPTLLRLKRVLVAAAGGRGYLATYATTDSLGRPVGQVYYAGRAPHLTRYDSVEDAQKHAINLPTRETWTLPEEAAAMYVRLYYQARSDEIVEVRAMYPVLLNEVDRAAS
jgi:hypothetical protein